MKNNSDLKIKFNIGNNTINHDGSETVETDYYEVPKKSNIDVKFLYKNKKITMTAQEYSEMMKSNTPSFVEGLYIDSKFRIS